MAEAGAPQQGGGRHAQPAEPQSEHMLKLQHDKAQRKVTSPCLADADRSCPVHYSFLQGPLLVATAPTYAPAMLYSLAFRICAALRSSAAMLIQWGTLGPQAAQQAELKQQWRDAEAERQRKLEEQQRAAAELEADRARQAVELEALKVKLERVKSEKQDLVLQ